jgi:hypothetical protein
MNPNVVAMVPDDDPVIGQHVGIPSAPFLARKRISQTAAPVENTLGRGKRRTGKKLTKTAG